MTSKVKVTQEQVEKIFADSRLVHESFGKKTLVVICTLRNGFIIVESSSCVDPANYDEAIGREICYERIKNKIWELEGYKLQCEVSNV